VLSVDGEGEICTFLVWLNIQEAGNCFEWVSSNQRLQSKAGAGDSLIVPSSLPTAWLSASTSNRVPCQLWRPSSAIVTPPVL